MLKNVSTMAILIDHSFFDPYAEESRQGCPASAFMFFNGDIISINSTTFFSSSSSSLSSDQTDEEDNDHDHDHDHDYDFLSYACLAIFRTRFLKMEGATAGFCLKSQTNSSKISRRRRVIAIFIWSSLKSCYSYILNSDCRKTIMPYLDGFPHLDIKYDVFKVVYASTTTSSSSDGQNNNCNNKQQ